MSQSTHLPRPSTPSTLDFYTVAETAVILGVSQRLVLSWIRAGVLPATRLGPGRRLIRIRRVDLEEFVEKFKTGIPTGTDDILREEMEA